MFKIKKNILKTITITYDEIHILDAYSKEFYLCDFSNLSEFDKKYVYFKCYFNDKIINNVLKEMSLSKKERKLVKEDQDNQIMMLAYFYKENIEKRKQEEGNVNGLLSFHKKNKQLRDYFIGKIEKDN